MAIGDSAVKRAAIHSPPSRANLKLNQPEGLRTLPTAPLRRRGRCGEVIMMTRWFVVLALASATAPLKAQVPGEVVGCGCFCGITLPPPCSPEACKAACGLTTPSPGVSPPQRPAAPGRAATPGKAATPGRVATNQALYGASLQLGFTLVNWLLSSSTDSSKKLQMMEELKRRQAEAVLEKQQEEANRLAAMYNNLIHVLKVANLPELQYKFGSSGRELTYKFGENAAIRDSTAKASRPPAPVASTRQLPGEATQRAGQLHATPGGNAVITPGRRFDPASLTPAQMADIISNVPPDELQRLMAMAQRGTAAGSDTDEALSANARAGFDTPVAFNPPTSDTPVRLQGNTPALLREPGTEMDTLRTSRPAQAPPPPQNTPSGTSPGGASPGAATSGPAPTGSTGPAGEAVPGENLKFLFPPDPKNDLRFLFPPTEPVPKDNLTFLFPPWHGGASNRYSSLFPKRPANDRPFLNPLWEEEAVKNQLELWDYWAKAMISQANRELDVRFSYSALLHERQRELVQKFAPDLLDRYDTDASFRGHVDDRLNNSARDAALAYYSAEAEAHKEAVLQYQAEMHRLEREGRLDHLVPLEEQYAQHPDRRQLVESVRQSVLKNEKAAVQKAHTDVTGWLQKQYRSDFELMRADYAPKH